MNTELMQRGSFICHSEACGGREFAAIPGLETTCPNCGSSEIEFLGAMVDDGRLVHLTTTGAISLSVPKYDATEQEIMAFRRQMRQEIDGIIAILPPAEIRRYDRTDGRRGGYFASPRNGGRRAVLTAMASRSTAVPDSLGRQPSFELTSHERERCVRADEAVGSGRRTTCRIPLQTLVYRGNYKNEALVIPLSRARFRLFYNLDTMKRFAML